MDRIPLPQVLVADRLPDTRDEFLADHETRAHRLEQALVETTDYAQRLRHELDAVRHYLIESAPANPRTRTDRIRSQGAAPTGPSDDEGWARWTDAVASVTSLLIGPRGNDADGRSEAEREEHDRRLAADAPRDEAG